MKKTISLVCIALAATACGQKQASTPEAQPAPIAPVVQPPPATPTHFYALKDGNEYGYEEALSEDARQRGQVATNLLMFNYLGEKDGAYQIMIKENETRTVAECSAPCEFAKIYTFTGTRFIDKSILKLPPNALLTQVFQDAMRGELDMLSGMQNDRMVSFWVDGEAKKLTIVPAGLK